ncbi:MAG: ABC transporter ATP-binding protein [Betaproteobacteria bacterium]|nr:ABC transporter ATP-binding protein [Betaproteobacteria bacterium]
MADNLLKTNDLSAWYGDFQAIFNINFEIKSGETVAVIGANGAGKSTFLRALAGALATEPGMIVYDGHNIGRFAAHQVLRQGIALVPEGRKLFQSLSVEENLQIGGDHGRPGSWTLKRVFDLFPVLAERRGQPATLLSGGQQQMCAIGRALMANPRLLLCDEISLGLAPVIIQDLYQRLAAISGEGTTLVIVEQDINRALEAADRFYCFQKGRVSLQGEARNADRKLITAAYFGL